MLASVSARIVQNNNTPPPAASTCKNRTNGRVSLREMVTGIRGLVGGCMKSRTVRRNGKKNLSGAARRLTQSTMSFRIHWRKGSVAGDFASKYFDLIANPNGLPGSSCTDNHAWILALGNRMAGHLACSSGMPSMNASTSCHKGSDCGAIWCKKSSKIPAFELSGMIQTPTIGPSGTDGSVRIGQRGKMFTTDRSEDAQDGVPSCGDILIGINHDPDSLQVRTPKSNREFLSLRRKTSAVLGMFDLERFGNAMRFEQSHQDVEVVRSLHQDQASGRGRFHRTSISSRTTTSNSCCSKDTALSRKAFRSSRINRASESGCFSTASRRPRMQSQE